MMKVNRQIRHFTIIAGLIVMMSILATWISPYDPEAVDMTMRNTLPSRGHIFGTDALGRDVLSRVIHGGRASLVIAFSATIASMLIGMILGALAGWFGRTTDIVAQILMSIFQGLPGLSISIAVVGVIGPSNGSIFLAMVLTSWASVARIVRSQIRSFKTYPFVEATKVYLPPPVYIIARHLFPLALPTLVVLAMNRMGRMILMIASLSFIGVGLQPPTPDWGVMIQDARMHMSTQPWALIAPSVMLFITAFTINRLGELMRDRWDVYSDDILRVS